MLTTTAELILAAKKEGFKQGLKEGARRERRALLKKLDKLGYYAAAEHLMISSKAKRANPLEGK